MEKIEELWDKLQLIEEEDVAITFDDEGVEEIQKKGDLCLIGKIWMERIINRGIIESTMANIWRLSTNARFKEVRPNMFII